MIFSDIRSRGDVPYFVDRLSPLGFIAMIKPSASLQIVFRPCILGYQSIPTCSFLSWCLMKIYEVLMNEDAGPSIVSILV